MLNQVRCLRCSSEHITGTIDNFNNNLQAMNVKAIDNGLIGFISLRQRFCLNALDVVSTKSIGGGVINECFHNALAIADRSGFKVVSGWLAMPYNGEAQTRHFVQHWWNYDPNLVRFIDTSPEVEDESIYITDHDIALLCTQRHEQFLTKCISTTILYRLGACYGIDHRSDGNLVRTLLSLKNEEIFPQCFID